MSEVGEAEVAAAYWEHHRLAASAVREDRLASAQLDWAFEAVSDAMCSRGPRAVSMLSALAGAATNDEELAALGAGPLEDLLHEQLDDADVDAIETAVRQTPRLRTSLGSVWWSEVADRAAARLRPLAP